MLLDNGRTAVLADEVGREALHCIRCSACLNVCPVYERTGGHAYGSVYPGPIGAVLSPQLTGVTGDGVNDTLPYASSLCGACYDACPVKIDIPGILVRTARAARGGARRGQRRPRRGAGDAGGGVGDELARAAGACCSAPRAWAGCWPGRAAAAAPDLPLPPPLSAWTAQPRRAACRRAETFREQWLRERSVDGGERAHGGAGRIRAALGPDPAVPDVVPRLPAGGRAPARLGRAAERLTERLVDYRRRWSGAPGQVPAVAGGAAGPAGAGRHAGRAARPAGGVDGRPGRAAGRDRLGAAAGRARRRRRGRHRLRGGGRRDRDARAGRRRRTRGGGR